MFFDGHNSFITASYFATGIVFLLAIIWVIADGKRLKAALKLLEEHPSRDEK